MGEKSHWNVLSRNKSRKKFNYAFFYFNILGSVTDGCDSQEVFSIPNHYFPKAMWTPCMPPYNSQPMSTAPVQEQSQYTAVGAVNWIMMNAAVVMPPPIKSPVTYNHNISILWSSIMAGKLHVKNIYIWKLWSMWLLPLQTKWCSAHCEKAGILTLNYELSKTVRGWWLFNSHVSRRANGHWNRSPGNSATPQAARGHLHHAFLLTAIVDQSSQHAHYRNIPLISHTARDYAWARRAQRRHSQSSSTVSGNAFLNMFPCRHTRNPNLFEMKQQRAISYHVLPTRPF